MPEQALDGIPLGLGLVVGDKPTEFHVLQALRVHSTYM